MVRALRCRMVNGSQVRNTYIQGSGLPMLNILVIGFDVLAMIRRRDETSLEIAPTLEYGSIFAAGSLAGSLGWKDFDGTCSVP